jgi:hypothetical protein
MRLQCGAGDVRALEVCGAELEALAGEVAGALEAEFLTLTRSSTSAA